MLAVLAAGCLPVGKSAEAPLACNLKALTHAERERHLDLTRTLFSAVAERRGLPDGYSFRLDPSRLTLAGIGEWMGYEHRCCPFFRFRVDVDEAGGVWLTLSGRPAVKQFIEAEFRLKE